MADAPETSSNANNESNKAVGAACFRCRGFRHACDRQKPACSRCRRRGITCTYPEAAPTLKKLQKATETLGERIRKFGDLLKSDGVPRAISLQRLAQSSPTDPLSPPSISELSSDARSSVSFNSDAPSDRDDIVTSQPVASTSSFSVYPCSKCFKDLQQCDLITPRCSRCEGNNFECVYMKTEPKANHVSQVLTTMNKVMDQWQESIDRMAKDFAQKTRDFSQRANNSLKMKPLQPFSWKITSSGSGLSVESNVNSYNDLSTLVDQFKRTMHISSRDPVEDQLSERSMSISEDRQRIAQSVELDDTSSIHTSSGFSFAVWNTWSHPMHTLPQDYPIDISDELTDNLVDLYCRSPCCSAMRLPIIDVVEFRQRYKNPDESKRPPKVLVYAICSMAARNAFQLHVWSKRPTHEAPQYNMGRALSMAYCLKGRELLSECFDEPTIEHCQAAFLLSYCHQQNGYTGAIYIYEWITFAMAQELGLYDANRELTKQECILVWCIYYFNTWYRVLQGNSTTSVESSHCYPRCELPCPPPKPEIDPMAMDAMDEPPQELVDYYVWSTWYYLIRLQVLRHDVMSRLVTAQKAGKSDTDLVLDLMTMQDRLEAFYNELPDEWRNPNVAAAAGTPTNSPPNAAACGFDHDDQQYHVDLHGFAKSCVLNVHLYYNINKILLCQAFLPSDHVPTNPFSIQCLHTCVDAAYSITQTLDAMVRQPTECSVPLLAFLFANIVYIKLLHYDMYQGYARRCLQLSVDISKASVTFLYDFEMAKNLVFAMEQDVRVACAQVPKRANSIDSSSDGWSMWSHTSVPSPPYHGQSGLSIPTHPSSFDQGNNGMMP